MCGADIEVCESSVSAEICGTICHYKWREALQADKKKGSLSDVTCDPCVMRLMSKDEWTCSFQVCASNFMVVESATGNKKKLPVVKGNISYTRLWALFHPTKCTDRHIHSNKSIRPNPQTVSFKIQFNVCFHFLQKSDLLPQNIP